MISKISLVACWFVLCLQISKHSSDAFFPQHSPCRDQACRSQSIAFASSHRRRIERTVLRATEDKEGTAKAETSSPAPVLNGKRVLPLKVMQAGVTGHKVAAVYALMNKSYKRGSEGWEQCEHIGVSTDFATTLSGLAEEHGEKVAHVRAMSFVVPSVGAMESIADDWRKETTAANGRINFDPVLAAMEMVADYDEDDDEDDMEFMEMTAQALSMGREASVQADADEEIVSPFDVSTLPKAATTAEGIDELTFNKENVNKVLDEIRPYLISDGGNVSVESVDDATRNVYLKLEGACGSCPSSTVTMQMGIERVLKENFSNLGEVVSVQYEEDVVSELTMNAVETEVNRIKPAIVAMGGNVSIVSVDGDTGIVQLQFTGASKVRQGLELAIQDIDFVTAVQFVE